MPKKSGLAKTVEEYSNRSTVHGIGYIFDKQIGYFDRFLWIIIVLTAMSMALYNIIDSYMDWQRDRVTTTLKTTTKPITDIDFPSVTICADGLHMGLVEEVLYDKFLQWDQTRPENIDKSLEENISKFMKEMYQISEGQNIFDILGTMISPESASANYVRKHQVSCKKSKRRKRNVPNIDISTYTSMLLCYHTLTMSERSFSNLSLNEI